MASFPLEIISAAKSGMTKYRVPASVSMAQWAIESGWGTHSPGYNPFGMKPRKGMNDPQQMLQTHEFVKGKDIIVMQPFRKFPSISAAFDAHAQLLASAPVYAPAMQCIPHDACPTPEAVDRFIDKMAPRYATDPLYASKLKSMIKTHDLGRYDNE